MSAFDLNSTFKRAEIRLSGAQKPRADRGRSRLPPAIEAFVHERLGSQERPSLSGLSREIAEYCSARGLRAPARTTLYGAIERAPVPRYRLSALPEAVQAALYNLRADGGDVTLEVPGDQVVFYALNYGNPHAISFAASMPWLCLERAVDRPGFRPKSRALLRAIIHFRGL